jgi:oligopeptide/dipeptide ABC transporter ATP-binding protein
VNGNGAFLSVSGLKVWFPVARNGLFEPQRWVRAVDGVDLSVAKGKTLGLVGESGSGKTTVGRAILRLIPSTAGSVVFDGRELLSMREGEMRSLRGRMQIVFQDPMSSLDPRMDVAGIVAEPLLVRREMSRGDRRRRVADLLDRVGLSSQYLKRYPHEFSGGQRQRIGIARALASDPDFVVCDEPVSALDVSIQAQILNLLADLQRDLGLSYLFIAHNLAVVEHFAHEVAVMYLGKIVERAERAVLYAKPMHPYTKSLLSAVPTGDPQKKSSRVALKGETPSPINPPAGCHFHPRCPVARDDCCRNVPELLEKEPGHWVRCPYAD